MHYAHITCMTMLVVHAFTMIIVSACTMIVVHACTTIIVHACTMFIVHVSCPKEIARLRARGSRVRGHPGKHGVWGNASPLIVKSPIPYWSDPCWPIGFLSLGNASKKKVHGSYEILFSYGDPPGLSVFFAGAGKSRAIGPARGGGRRS